MVHRPHRRLGDEGLTSVPRSASALGAARPWSRPLGWLQRKDPHGLAVKRSARAALVVPCSFGLAHVAFSDLQVSLFAAFGSFALLLLVEFQGSPRTRLVSYVSLLVVSAGLVALGTVLSTHKVAAVVAMAAVGFTVLYAGIASQSVATAATATLLMFVLPDAVASPASEVGARLLGLGIAGALSIPACLLVWRPPWRDDLRRQLSAAMTAISRLVRAHADGVLDPGAYAELTSELASMRAQFAATPYPQTGATRPGIALATLEARVEWAAANAGVGREEAGTLDLPSVRLVLAAVVDVLARGAALVCDATGDPVDDPAAVRRVREATEHLVELIGSELDEEISALSDRDAPWSAPTAAGVARPEPRGAEALAASLDPTFRARALGVATTMVADAVLESAGAPPVASHVDDEAASTGSRLVGRLVSHLSLHSVWFRNSVRGAAALALAVAIIEATNVEHGFWVVLGTLSVLRSSALGTGSTALRAVGGTTAGVVIGAAIMLAVGGHPLALWLLLPVAVLVAGTVPSMISFAAGQAGFTVVVVILFNIIAPAGWRVGLTRIEDVTIGCAVSVVVGLLFWPRGATAALGRSLADAFATDSQYLADAVERLTMPTRSVDTAAAGRDAHLSHVRLDDAFRQFLAERGAKVVSAEIIAGLFNGANRIRMAAVTMASSPHLPVADGHDELESVAVAGAVLRDAFASSHRWYVEFGALLADRRDALDAPPGFDATLADVLRVAFDDARDKRRVDQLRLILAMLWAEELLETQRQIQLDLAEAAATIVRMRGGRLSSRPRS
jgi:Fusaric acid resistance protein-like